MSIQRPSEPEEITAAVSVGCPFQGPKIHADGIYVLSGPSALTGPLADGVNHSATDYREQYLTGGGRERAAWHVIYYVSIADPDAPGSRFVIASVTATGAIRIQAHRALSKSLMAAISDGMRHMRTSRNWEAIATDHGDYPTHPEGYRDGEGLTFTLWGRDTRTDVRKTEALAHYTDRHEAYEARTAYEAAGEPHVSPVGYHSTHGHAWITRGAAPLGMTWGEWKEA